MSPDLLPLPGNVFSFFSVPLRASNAGSSQEAESPAGPQFCAGARGSRSIAYKQPNNYAWVHPLYIIHRVNGLTYKGPELIAAGSYALRITS
jgi:hypothetical protein